MEYVHSTSMFRWRKRAKTCFPCLRVQRILPFLLRLLLLLLLPLPHICPPPSPLSGDRRRRRIAARPPWPGKKRNRVVIQLWAGPTNKYPAIRLKTGPRALDFGSGKKKLPFGQIRHAWAVTLNSRHDLFSSQLVKKINM